MLCRHLHHSYVITRALLILLNLFKLLNLLNLLNLFDTLILNNFQPLPATFIKFEGGAQRPLRLIYI